MSVTSSGWRHRLLIYAVNAGSSGSTSLQNQSRNVLSSTVLTDSPPLGRALYHRRHSSDEKPGQSDSRLPFCVRSKRHFAQQASPSAPACASNRCALPPTPARREFSCIRQDHLLEHFQFGPGRSRRWRWHAWTRANLSPTYHLVAADQRPRLPTGS